LFSLTFKKLLLLPTILKIMKTLTHILIFTCLANFTIAQKGTVNVEHDKKITDLLAIYKSANSTSEYYRIQVGFGKHNEAQEIKSNVEVDFPNLPSKIDFESPTYRVKIGKFKTKLEAERKFIEIRKKYPNAMLLKPKKSSK